MGIVNETVQDGVGIGRIADYFVPSVYWKLGGNHRGAASVAFLEDFQKIVTAAASSGSKPQSSRMSRSARPRLRRRRGWRPSPRPRARASKSRGTC